MFCSFQQICSDNAEENSIQQAMVTSLRKAPDSTDQEEDGSMVVSIKSHDTFNYLNIAF